MGMAKLQKTFTTPEQSLRLLEIGIPASSADMVYYCKSSTNPPTTPMVIQSYKNIEATDDCIVCWSMGRLINIYETCLGRYYSHDRSDGNELVESIINKIVYDMDAGSRFPDLYPAFDISRLND